MRCLKISDEGIDLDQNSKKGSGMNDGTMVTIKPKAYWKMRMHVLRFGSNAKDRNEYKEVMGMLMGRTVKGNNPDIDDIIVEDAVPISHGGKVEVAFEPQDYVNFSSVDAKYGDEGLFNIGWYHSHPGLTCFFSAVDIRNQLGFQTANPAAIGIVFDHERFNQDDDMGFSVFRLDDPGKGAMSNYHEVDYMVESPEEKGKEFYLDVIKGLIDSYHKVEPPILELSETPDLFGDVSMPGRNSMMAKEPELKFSTFSENLSKSIEELSTSVFQPLFLYLNEWASTLTREVIDKNINILTILTDIKKELSKNMGDLQSWFKYQINDRLRTVDILIDDQLEMQLKQQEGLLEKLENMENGIKDQIGSAFSNALEATLDKYNQELDQLISNLEKSANSSNTLLSKVEEQNEYVDQGVTKLKESSAKIRKSADNLLSKVEMTMNTNLGSSGKSIEDVIEEQKDLVFTIKTLKGMIEDL